MFFYKARTVTKKYKAHFFLGYVFQKKPQKSLITLVIRLRKYKQLSK